MNFLMLPIHRPVAVAMFFLSIMLLGGVAWQKMPVELFPVLVGSEVNVSFNRPGSKPEVIEREILLPLQAQVSGMADVAETRGTIRGPSGNFTVRFEPGVDIKIREFELQRMVTEMQRDQPPGTWLNVQATGTGAISELAMMVHVLGSGDEDKDALFDLTEQLIVPRFASISGVSQATATGGAKRQVTVTVDPERTTAVGLSVEGVLNMVQRTVGRMLYTGSLDNEDGRTAVMLDGRPVGVNSLANARVEYNSPALLRHTSDVVIGPGREERLFRVNGKPAVGLALFQEQDSNLVRLGRTIRERVEEVRLELKPQGLDLVIGFDAADAIETQIKHLSKLGASGFAIALVVLFFFLRQWRAVAVVGLAVPVSLLTALAFLFLVGQSLNLVSLFGLMIAIGLVVDNSVVVFESIERHLQRGAGIENAVREGLRRTVRAILAASATTAVVFLPIILVEFEDPMIRQIATVTSLSILLPLSASLLVAIGLVPLLANYLAAPAAEQRLADNKRRRAERANLLPPDQAKLVFSGVVASALRNPPTWIAGTVAAVLLTVAIAVPWVMVNGGTDDAAEPDTIQLSGEFPSERTLDVSSAAMARLEREVLEDPMVESVETQVNESGGSLTIKLIDRDLRPDEFSAQNIRDKIYGAAKKVRGGFRILRPGDESSGGSKRSGGGAFGGTAAEIVLSGPDSEVLLAVGENVKAQLESTPQIENAWVTVQTGMSEFWVEPIAAAFESLGLTFNQVLPVLQLAGREGQQMSTGFVQHNGRELPLIVERKDAREENVGLRDLTRIRVQTPSGVMPVTALATMREMPPPSVISHRNGRREVSVMYRLRGDIPDTGPTRITIDEEIAASVRAIPRPSGVGIETDDENETETWFKEVATPAVALVYLVLAMTFESLILPVLVLLAIPLTILGAAWALAIAGISFEMMAALGALVLFGLTVNPAILLVDRMQQLIREGGWSAGAAAYAAVKERTRPVLMTTATTIAGLWPLAIVTGRENEIWPPFATVVIGGLITSSLLTLMLIPVGFILLKKVDEIFSRVGPWLVLVWMGSTVAAIMGLILTDTVTTLLWQAITGLLIGSALLALVVIIFRPRDIPEPDCSAGPPRLEVSHLHKTYGLPGPLKRALLAPAIYAKKVLARGGRVFLPADALDRFMPLTLGMIGMGVLATLVQSDFWQLFFWLVTGLLGSRLILEFRRYRGHITETGKVQPGGALNKLALTLPWLIIAAYTTYAAVNPYLQGIVKPDTYFVCTIAALFVAILQGMRRSARQQASGELDHRVARGGTGVIINIWRAWSARIAGLDLPVDPIVSLAGVNFKVDKGMIGILGPNGAGKTTLLRQLAGVLDPTRGTIRYGGVPLAKIQKHLARWVGYLPQDAGLPGGMSPREYLIWYAALYDIPMDIRHERVDSLLSEVGLNDKVDDKIKSLSGGMKQRVAVARTLLRLPPVIIVDEPTVGLDPRERIRFRNLLSNLARDRIVLMSTHVVEDVAVACDRVLVIAKGELVFDGGTDTLSDTATGHVWELRTAPGETPVLRDGAIATHETPSADGKVVHRIIAEKQPGAAVALDATLEDGYMWLLTQHTDIEVST
mgnify:CR=1 FL=1